MGLSSIPGNMEVNAIPREKAIKDPIDVLELYAFKIEYGLSHSIKTTCEMVIDEIGRLEEANNGNVNPNHEKKLKIWKDKLNAVNEKKAELAKEIKKVDKHWKLDY